MVTKVNPATLVKLVHKENVSDVGELANHFKVVPRTIERAMVRLGLRDAHRAPRLTREQIDRIRVLRREGLPTRWIAEDVGCDIKRVLVIGGPLPDKDEFARVWQYIRRNPTLVALHREFMPKGRRS